MSIFFLFSVLSLCSGQFSLVNFLLRRKQKIKRFSQQNVCARWKARTYEAFLLFNAELIMFVYKRARLFPTKSSSCPKTQKRRLWWQQKYFDLFYYRTSDYVLAVFQPFISDCSSECPEMCELTRFHYPVKRLFVKSLMNLAEWTRNKMLSAAIQSHKFKIS